ncbi:hypothetical protein CSIM01_09802 [Colletotrichum simmondsii]|uniref:Uncharacterized protein n=1 Tax=Colletotrichum simmondsii TaxID=703756 RepID=A0A135RX95_9PEZI|nr:hypothetical protein CSIM01_09802 [Colletotrichum simmondsii]
MVHFFDFPREIRDLVYDHYVTVKGGYILDFDSNTLRGAGNEPLDLAFIYTCKKAASDLDGLPLSLNTLTFSTIYSEKHRTTAGRFNLMVERLNWQRGRELDAICLNDGIGSDEVWAELLEAHPKFAPYLTLLRNRKANFNFAHVADINVGPDGSCGETPSVFRNFLHSALQMILYHRQQPDTKQSRDRKNCYADFKSSIGLESLVNLNPNPWAVPSREWLEAVISNTDCWVESDINRNWSFSRPGHQVSKLKHRYSAAAVAIRFLESMSHAARMGIRRIVLNEDWKAVGFAECHAMGLIPYCQENSLLFVDRRVDMWRTVFQTTTIFGSKDPVMPPKDDDSLPAHQISYRAAVWITEAVELANAGMPRGSFALTFEGDSTCANIFQTVIQRDAAWQRAIDLCLRRKKLPELPWDVRRENYTTSSPLQTLEDNRWYILEDFPRAMVDIVAGRSVVKCNFPLDGSWNGLCDVGQIIQTNQWLTMANWKAAWFSRVCQDFQPDAPSMRWVQMLSETSLETVLPLSRADEDDWMSREGFAVDIYELGLSESDTEP